MYQQPTPSHINPTLVWLLGIIILVFIIALLSGKKKPEWFSRWFHLYEGFQISVKDFYDLLKVAVEKRNLPDTSIAIVEHNEGGIFSAKRLYFRVKRKSLTFDICASLFGNGFFISWWLGESLTPGLQLINAIPFIGPLLVKTFNPETLYKVDVQTMFQEAIHNSVLEVLDEKTSVQGLRALTESERKPILSKLYK